jgi:uncharacterized damage-inducible protein DinB
MTALRMIRQLFEHMEWADALLWRSVLGNSVAACDSTVRERFLHIHMVQHGFLHLWRQQALPALPRPSDFPDTNQIASGGHEYHQTVSTFVAGLDETLLDTPLDIPWADQLAGRLGRPPDPVTVAQTMLQVASHSSHHRGQINVRLREVGAEPRSSTSSPGFGLDNHPENGTRVPQGRLTSKWSRRAPEPERARLIWNVSRT